MSRMSTCVVERKLIKGKTIYNIDKLYTCQHEHCFIYIILIICIFVVHNLVKLILQKKIILTWMHAMEMGVCGFFLGPLDDCEKNMF